MRNALLSRTLVALLLCASGATANAAGAAKADPAQGDGGVSAFYQWDAEIPAQPGKLLRTEPLPAAAGLAKASGGTQLRILYVSTDGVDGRTPTAVSGALFVPPGKPPADGWPLIAWAHGTVGVGDLCAPSWNARSPRDAAYLNRWLAEGYAVVSTDYQGLGTPGVHPYMVVRAGAYNVLDSVRAVAGKVASVGSRVVIVGQSQGGSVAFGSAATAPDYAPEIDLRGTVATGVPYYTPAMFSQAALMRNADQADPFSAYLLYFALAGKLIEPAVGTETTVHPAALALLAEARQSCIGELIQKVGATGLSRAQIITPAFFAVMDKYAPTMNYPTLKVPTPVFIGAGAVDLEIPAALQMKLAREACAVGTVIEAHLYPGEDHGGAVNSSLADSLPFVRKRFNGEALAPVCALAMAVAP